MIRIYKDTDSKVVTKGAYNTFYKPLGYKIVIEQTVSKRPKQEKVVENTEVQEDTRVTSSKRTKKGE